MSKAQFHPLQFHPETGEPFLRLPSPYDNIILTPPRLSDAPTVVAYMNDPAVYNWLEGPPFPYHTEHADSWLAMVKEGTDAALQELERLNADHPEGPLRLVSGQPVRMIREVRDDGTDLLLGDVAIVRERWPDVEDKEVKVNLATPNAEKTVGDPSIIWCIGDYLASSHHGRGIMTAAVKTLLHEWGIPRMGVRQVRVETFTDNVGSRRVFEKLGFVVEKTVQLENRVLNSGRKIDGMVILWWKAE
ncbi:GNAT domain-containing protein [Trametes meyenii]|nr:GNAT domain-containing protein [Trametes meyenii]